MNKATRHLNERSGGAQGIGGFFQHVWHFLREGLENGDSVLIHCKAGAHRAGCTASAVYMWLTQCSAAEAVHAVRRRRHVVDVNGDLWTVLTRLDDDFRRGGYPAMPRFPPVQIQPTRAPAPAAPAAASPTAGAAPAPAPPKAAPAVVKPSDADLRRTPSQELARRYAETAARRPPPPVPLRWFDPGPPKLPPPPRTAVAKAKGAPPGVIKAESYFSRNRSWPFVLWFRL